MNKKLYFSIAASAFYTTFLFALHAMEGSSCYSSFEGMTEKTYVARCFPKLPEGKEEAAERIITVLKSGRPIPIKEDDFTSENAFAGKEMTEGGASFPLNIEIQGPFLEYCSSGPFKRILDIGPGNGNDTIPILLTHNAEAIAVDIQQGQLEALSERARKALSKNFPDRLDAKYFKPRKWDFSREESVPSKYLKAFQGANLSRVLHFIKNQNIMIQNIANMLENDAMLSLTTHYLKPGSREEMWVKEQEMDGLENPNLVYYDIISKATPENQTLHSLGLPLQTEWKLVPQGSAGLSGPGYKKEFVLQNGSEQAHVIRQGRYYHTPDSVTTLLAPYFDILDSKIVEYDPEDSFLSVIARKKGD